MQRKRSWKIPLKFRDEYIHMAYHLALLGATDQQMADIFQVNRQTINLWKRTRVEFSDALKKGKTEADAKVAYSFYQNCLDRYVEEEEAKVVGGVVEVVKVKKFVRGDKWAQFRWLQTRQRNLGWSEAQNISITQTSTSVNIDLKEMSFEELKFLESIGYKQLPEYGGSN